MVDTGADDYQQQEWRRRLIGRLVQADIEQLMEADGDHEASQAPLQSQSAAGGLPEETISAISNALMFNAPGEANPPREPDDFVSAWEKMDEKRAVRRELIALADACSRWSRILKGALHCCGAIVAIVIVGIMLHPLISESAFGSAAQVPNGSATIASHRASPSQGRYQPLLVQAAEDPAMAPVRHIQEAASLAVQSPTPGIQIDRSGGMPPLMIQAMGQASHPSMPSGLPPEAALIARAEEGARPGLRAAEAAVARVPVTRAASAIQAKTTFVRSPAVDPPAATTPVKVAKKDTTGTLERPMALGNPVKEVTEPVTAVATRTATRVINGGSSSVAGIDSKAAPARRVTHKNSVAPAQAGRTPPAIAPSVPASRRESVDAWSPFREVR